MTRILAIFMGVGIIFFLSPERDSAPAGPEVAQPSKWPSITMTVDPRHVEAVAGDGRPVAGLDSVRRILISPPDAATTAILDLRR